MHYRLFGVLTPEAQQKVSDAIKSLKDGKGTVVTGTPVGTLVPP
jgi:hypothetical protein